MPELPEVETIVRGLRRKIIGQRIRSIRVLTPTLLRSPVRRFRNTLTGVMIREMGRKGKFILIRMDSGHLLVIHLKMTGQLLITPPDRPIDKHTHLIFDLEPGGLQLRYRDVRKFGRLAVQCPAERSLPQLEALAPDPFELTAEAFHQKLGRKKRALKPLLLDQGFISGLGNIYVDESLYRAQIHPATPADRLNRDQARNLHRLIRLILRQAIQAKGTTVSDYRGPEGIVGGFQHHLRVYGCTGKPCRVCRTPIAKLRLGGRGTHICPGCQKKLSF